MDKNLIQPLDVKPVESLGDISWLNIALIIVGSMAAVWLMRRAIKHFVRQFMKRHKYTTAKERQKRFDTLVSVFNTIIAILVSAIALALILVQLGVDLAAAAASIGALGVVLGIAGQSLFKSVLRGLVAIMGNQMRIGDIVALGGVSGTVEEISLVNTRLRDLDGTLHIVPNGEITVLTNFSMGFANVNLDVRISYNSDIDKVIKVINKLGQEMASEDHWREIIQKPISFLRVDSFGESGVNIKALGEVVPGEQWATAGEFRKRLLVEFAKNNIEIPLPQRVIKTTTKGK